MMPLPRSFPLVLFAGVGCTATATADDLFALLQHHLPAEGTLVSLASLDRRCHLSALTETATRLQLPLLALPDDTLRRFPAATPSAAARFSGLPSVAEAAALASAQAMAHPGQSAVLWLAKQTGPGCTVALAVLTTAPECCPESSVP